MFTNNFRKQIEVKCPNSFKVLKTVLKLFVYFTSVCFFLIVCEPEDGLA
jgi:hypothetical protein